MVLTQEEKNVFYLQQICSDLSNNVFRLAWSNVAIHNCDVNAKLLDPKSVEES